MTKKVCISGYYGFDNFGDETILKILTETLKLIIPDIEITVFSSSPEKTAEELNVKSTYTFKIPQIIKEIYNTDTLISGGGSLLQDVTSIKSLIYYLGVILTAKLFGKKIIIFSQGIGPISNKILKKITFFLLKRANLITVRDEESHKLLQENKINAIKTSDPVWNLPAPQKKSKPNTLGIQLRDSKNLTENFITAFAEAINKNYGTKDIYIYSLQNKLDLEISNKLKDKLLKLNPNINIQTVENTSNEKVINDITQMEELIAMRYHACLIAIKSGIKLLPVNYDIKVKNIAEEFNLEYIDLNNYVNINEQIENFRDKEIKYNQEKIKNLSFNFELIKNVL